MAGSASDPLHNSSQSVISPARADCCVVFLVNSQLLNATRRLASHPDPLDKFSPWFCRGFLDQQDFVYFPAWPTAEIPWNEVRRDDAASVYPRLPFFSPDTSQAITKRGADTCTDSLFTKRRLGAWAAEGVEARVGPSDGQVFDDFLTNIHRLCASRDYVGR